MWSCPIGPGRRPQSAEAGQPLPDWNLHNDVGGLWDIDNPHSNPCTSTHTRSPQTHDRNSANSHARPPVAFYPHHKRLRQYYCPRLFFAEHFQPSRTTTIWHPRHPHGPRGAAGLVSECKRRAAITAVDGVLIAQRATLHTPTCPSLPGRNFAGPS